MNRLTLLLSRAPLTRSQVIFVPWCGGLMGVISSCFYLRYLSNDTVVLMALCLGSLMLILAGWVAYRSDFATRHGLVAPLLMLLLLVPLTAGMAVLTLNMAGALIWRGWAVVSVGGSLLLVFAGAVIRQWRLLQPQGLDGPWVREHVDPVSGRLRADALMPGSGGRTQWSPVWVAALAANIPLIYHSWGVSDLQAMPIVMVGMLLTGMWICAGYSGPTFGKALFLLRWERHAGRRLVHEGWEDLQALRRSFWLSRWLMLQGGDSQPVPTPAEGRAKPKLRHGRR